VGLITKARLESRSNGVSNQKRTPSKDYSTVSKGRPFATFLVFLRFLVHPQFGRFLRLTLIILVGSLVAFWCFPPTVEEIISANRLTKLGDRCYASSLVLPGGFVKFRSAGETPLRFCENSESKGWVTSSLKDVILSGAGRFCHDDDFLYFSTKDSSDPRISARKYSISGPVLLTSKALRTVFKVCSVLLVLVIAEAVFSFRKTKPEAFDSYMTKHNLMLNFVELRRLKRLSKKVGYVPELDGIRGLACLSVLLAHCLIGTLSSDAGNLALGIKQHTLTLLLAGVDLFFVLSGFLIGGILMDTRNQRHFFKRFWIRRIARIFPVLWILLLTVDGGIKAQQIGRQKNFAYQKERAAGYGSPFLLVF